MDQRLTFSLLNYLNNKQSSDTYYDITCIILNNISTIPSLSITELADLCYVSPSTITRFCKYFGCQNYIDFKNQLNNGFKKHIEHSLFHIKKDTFQAVKHNPKDFMNHYATEIATSAREVSEQIDYKQIDSLIHRIHNTKMVYLFGMSTSLLMVNTLQHDLLNAKKVTYTGDTSEKLLELANNIKEDDLAIVFSAYGNFISAQSEIVHQLMSSKAHLVLITLDYSDAMSSIFDETINLTKNHLLETGSYAMFMGIEYIVRRYTALYIED